MLSQKESADVLAQIEALRNAEWQARQPLLERFRNTPDEQKQRAIEGPIPVITLSECVEGGRIEEFSESLAKLCREGLRFERWLDTLSANETASYREIRRRLP